MIFQPIGVSITQQLGEERSTTATTGDEVMSASQISRMTHSQSGAGLKSRVLNAFGFQGNQ